MSPPTEAQKFGALVAASLGNGPNRMTMAAQRARLLSEVNRVGVRSSRGPLLAWAFAGMAVLAVALGLHFGGTSQSLEARFGGRPLSERTVAAGAVQPEALSFSDGSVVVLQPNARAEVSRLDATQANLTLDRGKIAADIRKRTGTTWTINVGPYSVRVVGTRFTVDWDPATHLLKVAVEEGRVQVSGGDLTGDGVALDAGKQLERHYAPEPSTNEALGSPSASPVAPDSFPVLPEERQQPSPNARAVGDVSAPAGSSSPDASWLSLASKGSYREALSVAVQHGFDKLASSLPEDELLVLANTARYSGDAVRARGALLKLRQRFAGRPGARLAALYLARVAEDLERRPLEAARWLRVFVQESPNGDLSASARVNLMSILLQAGDHAGARAVAQDYLDHHPNGAHRNQARSVLGER